MKMATQQPNTEVERPGSCTAAHGILHNLSAREESRRHGPGHLKWDEESIAEQDKERGTRMKIDEPPTPYHRDHPDYKGVSAAALRERLEKVEMNDAGQALTSAEVDMKKKEDFERRRRLHYLNEKKDSSAKAAEETSDDEE